MAGISWQAAALNFVGRHTLKRGAARHGLSTSNVRKAVRLLELLGTGVGGGQRPVLRRLIAGVPCDVLFSTRAPRTGRTLLYLHGGGFFAHLPRSYRRHAQRLADTFGATVYLPDYRLAPEHRYPAATDDCYEVYRALLDDGCDPARLCVMGDSAGGNLALVTLLRARDDGLSLPACASVISPGADLTLGGVSFTSNAVADPFVPLRALRQAVDQYVDAAQIEHPYVSPIFGDFRGLPPLEIIVGSTEVLLDSAHSAAAACHAARVPVALHVWQQMPHVFPLFSYLPEARAAMLQTTAFINDHLAPLQGH